MRSALDYASYAYSRFSFWANELVKLLAFIALVLMGFFVALYFAEVWETSSIPERLTALLGVLVLVAAAAQILMQPRAWRWEKRAAYRHRRIAEETLIDVETSIPPEASREMRLLIAQTHAILALHILIERIGDMGPDSHAEPLRREPRW